MRTGSPAGAIEPDQPRRETPEERQQQKSTVDDPVMYSKPWVLSRVFKPLQLNPKLPELIEYSCSENNKDIQHLISTKPALGKR
ncbi:MAG TPA: hypothetical protein VMB25_11525, partial [Bryobacteraceae bacterium]|nr:hypothetical protein [Bryobacteraceae bacterium]